MVCDAETFNLDIDYFSELQLGLKKTFFLSIVLLEYLRIKGVLLRRAARYRCIRLWCLDFGLMVWGRDVASPPPPLMCRSFSEDICFCWLHWLKTVYTIIQSPITQFSWWRRCILNSFGLRICTKWLTKSGVKLRKKIGLQGFWLY